ncbi:MAG: helix-turn-helix domain-containing protein, partial [Patescibacteria group bacterium]|nr:helix-turn-helix domain-containing protein [Patescibacteria group bacterium]
HRWPGNVRELYNTLERALLIGGGRITAEIARHEIRGFEPGNLGAGYLGAGNLGAGNLGAGSPDSPSGGFQAAVNRTERELLEEALRATGGNKTAAAASLGMKPSTFRDKLAKHGL